MESPDSGDGEIASAAGRGASRTDARIRFVRRGGDYEGVVAFRAAVDAEPRRPWIARGANKHRRNFVAVYPLLACYLGDGVEAIVWG